MCVNCKRVRFNTHSLCSLTSCQDAVRRLREKMISNKAENSSLEEDLTATIHEVNCRSHALQDHLTQSHTAARKRLTELTVQGDAAAKNLQAVVTKVKPASPVCITCRNCFSPSVCSAVSGREGSTGRGHLPPAGDATRHVTDIIIITTHRRVPTGHASKGRLRLPQPVSF